MRQVQQYIRSNFMHKSVSSFSQLSQFIIKNIKSNKQYPQTYKILSNCLIKPHASIKITKSIFYSFTSSNKQQTHKPKSQTNNKIALQQIKLRFETKMNKYNLKGVLNMYQILVSSNIAIKQQALKLFDYRLQQELDRIDHQSLNVVLNLLNRNGQVFRLKGKSKLLRGINLLIQKNRIKINHQQLYRTIQLLTQMKFPNTTLAKLFYNIVREQQVDKRILSLIDNLKILKISLICLQAVYVDLEIKRRFFQNVIKIKPNNLTELVYFYSILKNSIQLLDRTVRYESQKKSVYDLAFNPYSFYQTTQPQTQSEKQSNPSNTQTNKQQSQPASNPQEKKQINQRILKQLLQQKQKILQQTLKKINLSKLSQQLTHTLKQTIQGFINEKSQNQITFKEIKQIALMLISNRFDEQSKQNANILNQISQYLIQQGLKLNNNNLDTKKIIKVSEFIVLVQQILIQSNQSIKTIQQLFAKYYTIYGQYMNLQQKFTFLYHKSKILNKNVDIELIKQQIMQVEYGLNAMEFGWLNKLLNRNVEKQSQKDKKMAKEILFVVEKKIDQEIQQMKNQALKDKNNQDKGQVQDKLNEQNKDEKIKDKRL